MLFQIRFYNAKVQGPAPKPRNNFNNIPLVTTFPEDANNRIVMKNIKRKIENNPSSYLKEIFKNATYSYHNVNLKVY